jgi:flavin-dependent dehydrogenase
MGVALEGNLSHDRADAARYAQRMVIELGVVPGGYGWVFPKGDHVNFGVGGWASEGPRLRGHLARLCDAHSASVDELTDIRGYRLPYRHATSKLTADGLLLIGDAAGLVDPLSGDGMYEAFVSARLAAAAVVNGDLAAYPRNVAAELGALHTTSWAAKRALDRFPRLTFALLRLPVTWPVLAKTLRGDLGDPTAARGLGRLPLRALHALGRAA